MFSLFVYIFYFITWWKKGERESHMKGIEMEEY